jgi:hypothetical protein
LILGNDWLKEACAVLDWNNSCLTVQKGLLITRVPVTFTKTAKVEFQPSFEFQSFYEHEEPFDLEEYESEELDKTYVYYSGLSSDEEEPEDILGFNPWANETSPKYDQNSEEDNNPAIYIALAENTPWDKKKDLHVGPLDDHQQQQFQNLIQNNYDICAASQTDIGRTDLIQHTVHTGDVLPFHTKAY